MPKAYLAPVILLLFLKGMPIDAFAQGQVGREPRFTTILLHPFDPENESYYYEDFIFSTKRQHNSSKAKNSITFVPQNERGYETKIEMKIADTISLYDSIKAGKTIRETYIKTLDLSKLALQKSGKEIIIPYSLKFVNCWIENIFFPDEYVQPSSIFFDSKNNTSINTVVFEKEILFQFCTFGDAFILHNAIFQSRVSFLQNINYSLVNVLITNSTFLQDIYVYSHISENIGKDSALISEYPRQGFYFWKNVYRGKVFIYCSLPESRVHLENSTFLGKVYLCNYPKIFSKFPNQLSDFPLVLDDFTFRISDTLRWIKIINCNFNRTVNFQSVYLQDCEFDQCSFSDSLIIYDTQFDSSSSLVSCYFQHRSENIVIVNPSKFNIKELKFSPYAFGKIRFPYISGNTTIVWDEKNMQDYNNYYDRLESDINNIFTNKKEIAEELINKL